MQWRTIFIVFLFFSTGLRADDATDRLEHFFFTVNSFKGLFTQTVYDENGKEIQKSQGKVFLQKPGKFRWEYEKPFPQLILADGKYLWIYDQELAQATAKPLEDALGAAPIMLLTQIQPLTEEFTIKPSNPRLGLEWVELIPKVQDTEFLRIEMGLDKETVRQMELHDQFSQKTVVLLYGIQTNLSLSAQLFEFKPPKGVDVIGYQQ